MFFVVEEDGKVVVRFEGWDGLDGDIESEGGEGMTCCIRLEFGAEGKPGTREERDVPFIFF